MIDTKMTPGELTVLAELDKLSPQWVTVDRLAGREPLRRYTRTMVSRLASSLCARGYAGKVRATGKVEYRVREAGSRALAGDPEFTGWAGRGFTGPPAAPDPSELQVALRRQLRLQHAATLADLESIFLGPGSRWHRNDLIETLASMRDDGEVRFHGPRYVWITA
jgi:hypothetical protein